jgi:eukaryotic-like serine/threonine-protein kinase
MSWIGAQLGPYAVDSFIAKGGMGEVYRAHDTRLNRPVALKVLAHGLVADGEGLARFTQEARTTARLNHPNIVSVFDVGAHAGVPFVVSELLEGKTLRRRLNDGLLSVRAALAYALEIAHGLIAAHDIGVVHRDLKPENIFITRENRVKILDFGLAKVRSHTLRVRDEDSAQSTRPGTLLGTVGYMAPEQVLGERADQRSDIFSFGVMLHEMIAGAAPFQADSAVETLYAILKHDTPPLPERAGGVPEGLGDVVEHCLEKTPSARFQSARDLAFTLDLVARSAQTVERRARDRRQAAPLLPRWSSSMFGFPAAVVDLCTRRFR